MKIASLHFGSGSGHLQNGIILWDFLRERVSQNIEFSLLTDSGYDVPINEESLSILNISLEPEKLYCRDRETMLYQYLKHIDPDLIIVDSIWFPVKPLLNELKAKKVLFSCYLPYKWFNPPPFPNGETVFFEPDNFDLLFSIEPGFGYPGSSSLPPLIHNMEHRIEQPDRIRSILNVPADKKLALLAHNGHEGEINTILDKAEVDREDFFFFTLSQLDPVSRHLFPLVHYMGGVDLAIGGSGYHFFYETKFHNIPSIYIPQPRIGNEQHWRLENNNDYQGPYNGAELMVEQILSLM
ncbi:MAG: hypothetical protein PQJ58_13100 [Spirochaetales bacterium]|nr:hypothetical protein [Spirochaetales bacterium]